MSQTDHARRRQCVPPPSVKGRRSVFPRRIAGEAVFSPFSKPIRKRIQVRRPLHPLQLHTNCPRNSRVGVDCQTVAEPHASTVAPAIRAWVWIASGRKSPTRPLWRTRNSRVGVDCQNSRAIISPRCLFPQFARGCGLPATVFIVRFIAATRNSRVGVDCQHS